MNACNTDLPTCSFGSCPKFSQVYTVLQSVFCLSEYEIYLLYVSIKPGGAYSVDSRLLTCANEHHIVLAVFCVYSIYHDLCELVIHVRFNHDWTVVDGEYWVVHGWVTSGKRDNFIRKVLGGIKTSKCFTGTLEIKNQNVLHFIIYHPIYCSL